MLVCTLRGLHAGFSDLVEPPEAFIQARAEEVNQRRRMLRPPEGRGEAYRG
jgi:hypothetical protein